MFGNYCVRSIEVRVLQLFVPNPKYEVNHMTFLMFNIVLHLAFPSWRIAPTELPTFGERYERHGAVLLRVARTVWGLLISLPRLVQPTMSYACSPDKTRTLGSWSIGRCCAMEVQERMWQFHEINQHIASLIWHRRRILTGSGCPDACAGWLAMSYPAGFSRFFLVVLNIGFWVCIATPGCEMFFYLCLGQRPFFNYLIWWDIYGCGLGFGLGLRLGFGLGLVSRLWLGEVRC